MSNNYWKINNFLDTLHLKGKTRATVEARIKAKVDDGIDVDTALRKVRYSTLVYGDSEADLARMSTHIWLDTLSHYSGYGDVTAQWAGSYTGDNRKKRERYAAGEVVMGRKLGGRFKSFKDSVYYDSTRTGSYYETSANGNTMEWRLTGLMYHDANGNEYVIATYDSDQQVKAILVEEL